MGETDLISRQAAIEIASDKRCGMNFFDPSEKAIYEVLSDVIHDLFSLPSAQPDIVRCKDCKNSEHWYRDRRRCFLWSEEGVSVFNDGFCNYAERRTDEQIW